MSANKEQLIKIGQNLEKSEFDFFLHILKIHVRNTYKWNKINNVTTIKLKNPIDSRTAKRAFFQEVLETLKPNLWGDEINK